MIYGLALPASESWGWIPAGLPRAEMLGTPSSTPQRAPRGCGQDGGSGLCQAWRAPGSCCLPSAPVAAQASPQLGHSSVPSSATSHLLHTVPPDLPQEQNHPHSRDPSCLAGFWTGISLSRPGMHVLPAFKHPEEPLAPELSSLWLEEHPLLGRTRLGGQKATGENKRAIVSTGECSKIFASFTSL